MNFPFEAPFAFLDEEENPSLVEYIDYIEKGNRINFQYLFDWQNKYK